MSLQDLLAELQRNYLASFPEKVANLESLWKSGQIQLLETEYHKLKGTGKTYGLGEVSQVGEAMERICETAPALLERTVPLSLSLLMRIHTKRTHGESLLMDEDSDFQAIIGLLK